MSVNWSKKDFAQQLCKATVFANNLRVGDIMIEDGNPIGVARVVKRGKRICVYDKDKNGWEYDRDTQLIILPRQSVLPT